MVDKYIEKFRSNIKNSKNDEEIDTVLNKIYEDGFGDGANEGV